MPRGQYERKPKTATEYEVKLNKEKENKIIKLTEEIYILTGKVTSRDNEIIRLNEVIRRYMGELLDCYRKLSPHN